MLTCATMPSPKKLFSRAKVRSINWSAITKRPGGISSRSDPTAEMERMSVHPARLSASIFARALRFVGDKDRKSVVEGKCVSVRVDLGGRRIIKKKKEDRHMSLVANIH